MLGRTLREEPVTSVPGMGIALRAGLARMVGNRLVLLPHGVRALDRLRHSIRRSISSDAEPVDVPAGRAEEFWLDLLREEIQSYRQLPCHLVADRDVLREKPPQAGERPALQWVFAVADEEQLEIAASQWRKGLDTWLGTVAVPAAPSTLEGGECSWIFSHPKGSDPFLRCASCGYLASQEIARFQRSESVQAQPDNLRMVETPGATTIHALASFLGVEQSQTLKALFFVTTHDELVFVILRGDREVSLMKLALVTGCVIAGRAQEAVIRGAGAEPGFASPVGLQVRSPESPGGLLVVGDLSLLEGRAFVAGANKPGYHWMGVNYPRDFRVTILADIASARSADPCPVCGQPMSDEQGMVLAHWSTHAHAFDYADTSGGLSAGPAGIGTAFLDRLLAALLVAHSDERGMAWPRELAPYQIHVVSLGPNESAEPFVARLLEAGLIVLWDDRQASPGVKFADADLIGCPVRLTVSRRSIEKGGAEVSRRGGKDPRIVGVDLVPEAAKSLL